jgi:hypothetical protein
LGFVHDRVAGGFGTESQKSFESVVMFSILKALLLLNRFWMWKVQPSFDCGRDAIFIKEKAYAVW